MLVASSELGDIFLQFYFASLGLTELKTVIGHGISMSPRSRYLKQKQTYQAELSAITFAHPICKICSL